MSIEAQNITFSYEKGKEPILKHINLSVNSQERVGIVAPSGFGKTTLMKVLGGYLVPDTGEIRVDGQLLPQKGYCPIQMIWQHPEKSVNPRLKMKEVLLEGQEIDPHIIHALGIEQDWLNRYPQEISGGELQRFCIARALGKGTKYLIADEISTMLDLITQGQIWQFLLEETKKRKIGMIVVSHSKELMDYVCTRQIVLES